ncbi:MAG: hypothetical protein ACD_26C00050G0001 [uncultured bacterium]|nr:MAG: hypothetical protein ACD_26C00050G0001 [uncultured bacterium]
MLGPNKKVYSIIIEKSVKQDIHQIAKKNHHSDSNLINFILKEYIEDEKRRKDIPHHNQI